MDLPLLPVGRGRGRSCHRRRAWNQFGYDLAGRTGDVSRLSLLPDAHNPGSTPNHLWREPRKRSLTCWFISRALKSFPGIFVKICEDGLMFKPFCKSSRIPSHKTAACDCVSWRGSKAYLRCGRRTLNRISPIRILPSVLANSWAIGLMGMEHAFR